MAISRGGYGGEAQILWEAKRLATERQTNGFSQVLWTNVWF